MAQRARVFAKRTTLRLLKLWCGVLLVAMGLLGSLAGCKPDDPERRAYPAYGVFPAGYLVMPDFDAND